MTRVEFVGGPRDGEQRVLEEHPPREIRFALRSTGKTIVLYRRRPNVRRTRGGDVILYDYMPPVAA